MRDERMMEPRRSVAFDGATQDLLLHGAREALMPKRIRVLLINDCCLICDALRATLDARPELHVVATAADIPAGLRQIPEVMPDVVLMAAGLATEDRDHWVQQIRMSIPPARVIVMDLPPVPEEVFAFAKAGANGVMTKDARVGDLVAMMRSVTEGVNAIPPGRAGPLRSHIAAHAVSALPALPHAVRLTTREREIMELLAEGLGNKAIAHRLGIADDTVKSHVRNMLEKLALHSRLEIAAHSHRARMSEAGASGHNDARSEDRISRAPHSMTERAH